MAPAHKAVGDAAVQVRCAGQRGWRQPSGSCPTPSAAGRGGRTWCHDRTARHPSSPGCCARLHVLPVQAAIREAELLLEEVQSLKL